MDLTVYKFDDKIRILVFILMFANVVIKLFYGRIIISMLIRDRIFQKLDELDMTQKEFSIRTGIPQTTISDWRKKRTNPTAEKIMVICKVLDVTPEWLLSGIEPQGDRGNPQKWYAIDSETEVGRLVVTFNAMNHGMQERLLGYAEALSKMKF